LREALFELAVTGGSQGILADDAAWLDEGSLNFVDEAGVDWEGETVTDVLVKELPYLVGTCLRRLVIATVNVGLEFGLALVFRELRFESVVHSFAEDRTEESKVGVGANHFLEL
jgi:hypothetical protein